MTDPKPPDQKPAQETKPYISSRLREKIEESEGLDDWSPKSGSPLMSIVVALVVIGAAVGGFMWLRAAARSEQAKEAAAAAEAARRDSIETVARAESLTVAMRADSLTRARADSVAIARGEKPARPKPTAPAGGSRAAATPPAGSAPASSTPATPPPPSTDGFGILVGTYMAEDRANSEKDRLSAATGLPGLVSSNDEGFRVILGKYPSRGAADRQATALADSGVVREARVVARPR